MSQSTRFSVAIHLLVALALRDDRLTSEELAWSAGTNASMVRRILGSLARAGLVASIAGPTGGAEIAKDPRRIALVDVLRAVDLQPPSGVHSPNPECPLGSILDVPLTRVFAEAEEAAEAVLEHKTVHDIAVMARRRIGRAPRKRGS